MDQRTPIDEDFYPDILRGLSVYFDSAFVRNIARTTKRFRRPDLSNALNRKQVACKKWLADELHRTCGGEFGTIWVLGGWYGVLSALIFEDERFDVSEIVSFDIDAGCEDVAESLNRETFEDGGFKARTADMYQLDYGSETPDLIVNTSCEHVADLGAWLDLIPPGARLVLQSNNYFGEPDHVNCVHSLQEFKQQAQLVNVDFEGELAQTNYTRYMLIGSR